MNMLCRLSMDGVQNFEQILNSIRKITTKEPGTIQRAYYLTA
jgi:hypothetical protein